MTGDSSTLSGNSPAPEPLEALRDLVPFRIKLAFGFGEYGLSLSANFLIIYLLVFLTTVAGLRSDLAGAILLIGKIVDAVTDPMVGTISDRAKSVWGRRLPFMAIGAPILAVAFLGQLWVPSLSETWLFVFYLVVGVLAQLFYSVVTIPYTSLAAEMTQDYEERTSLNGFRQIFSILGSISALVIAMQVFKGIPDDPKMQYLIMGFIGAGIIVSSILISVAGIRKYVLMRESIRLTNSSLLAEHQPTPNLTLAAQLRIAFANRPFLIVCMLYLFAWMAVQVTITVLTFYLIYWMQIPNEGTPQIILAVMLTALLMLPLWSLVSHRIGKKSTFIAGACIWLVAQCLLLFIQPGQTPLLIAAAVLAGFGVSVCYLIPWAMLPDVIEFDELETGQRREGVFYGLIVFLQKLAVAVAIFMVGNLLQWVGFDGKPPEGFVQPDSALLALRLLVGPLPMIFLVLAITAAAIFPINKEKHAEVLEKLRLRREGAKTPHPQS